MSSHGVLPPSRSTTSGTKGSKNHWRAGSVSLVANSRRMARIFLRISMPSRMVSSHSRSEEHTSELQSLMRISYAVFCLKKKKDEKYSRRIPTQNNDINQY